MKRLKNFLHLTLRIYHLVSTSFVLCCVFGLFASSCKAQSLHKIFKYSTVYAAVNGGTSLGTIKYGLLRLEH